LSQRRSRVRYTIKHTIETDLDTFWSKVFFDAEFNRALFQDHLGFSNYRVLEERIDPDGVVHRKVASTPKVELPAAARKIFGDNLGYTEIGRYDPSVRRYYVQGIPNIGAEKVKTHSEIWAEPVGDKRIERIVNVDNTVKVFGLGTLLEGFIEQQTRDLYARGAEFTNRWIREKNL
jgi:hypothetical protein